MKTLRYCGQVGGPFGWGVFGQEITRALAQHFTLTDGEADVCFVPIADHDFNAASPARGRINIGMSFFEFPLGEKAAENAKRYDTVFVGSTWCLDRCWERGITNAKVLLQGVDHEIFKPGWHEKDDSQKQISERRKSINQFRIFSGGKFEWRKGQDLVIAAFAEFAKTHPDAHLVAAWHNNWTNLLINSIHDMGFGRVFDRPECKGVVSQTTVFAALLETHGIPRDRFTILPQLDQPSLAAAMRNTDVGLFPNRCEGGTNLVLMEYSACDRKVVANMKTGHADVAGCIDYAIPASEDENRWAEQKVEDIVKSLELACADRELPRVEAPTWTWASAAATVAEEVERIAGSK